MLRLLQADYRAHETLRERRREVEACLARHGFGRGPRLWLREAASRADEGRRLSSALLELGPVFTAFGRYLATRVDVLPVSDCLALAALADYAPALPGAQVWELIGQELGCAPTQIFTLFETEPCEARWLFQAHHARLRSGEAVTLKVARAELPERFAHDAELLWLIAEALSHDDWRAFLLENADTDFRRQWEEQSNFVQVAARLSEFASETARDGWLRVPYVHRHLSTARLLVVEHLPGVSLAELLNPAGQVTAVTVEGAAQFGWEMRQLANRLWVSWLQQALQGRLFPALPQPAQIKLLPAQQLAFTGHSFVRLPAEAQTNLGEYLVAAAAPDLDRACAALLREMESAGAARSAAEVEHRLRQLAPFRDGGWEGRSERETLAEHLFLHWRLAGEQGYRLRPRALAFSRGCFALAATAQSLAPAHDPLREGLEDWRLHTAFAQFRELFGLRQLGENADKYAALWLTWPQKLDEALTLVAEGRTPPGIWATALRRRRSPSAVVLALMLLLAAVVVIAHHLSATAAGVWVDRISALVFVSIGVLLLRAASSGAES